MCRLTTNPSRTDKNDKYRKGTGIDLRETAKAAVIRCTARLSRD